MMSLSRAQNKISKIYRSPKGNIYSHRFYEELCTGYSFTLGVKSERDDFLSIEPKDCKLAKLLNVKHCYDLSRNIEETIEKVIYSLVVFGKAYIYLKPEYSESDENDMTRTTVLTSLEIREIKGFVMKRDYNNLVFCCRSFDGSAKEIKMSKNQLISFDIRDLGYRKNYFNKIFKKLGKTETVLTLLMTTEKVEGYDFSAHFQRMKMDELKATKNIGWSFGAEGLSDSYILYKKIQQDELKLQFLNYIVEKINMGLANYLNRSIVGKMVAHTKEIKIDRLWDNYTAGKITGTELTNILYDK